MKFLGMRANSFVGFDDRIMYIFCMSVHTQDFFSILALYDIFGIAI